MEWRGEERTARGERSGVKWSGVKWNEEQSGVKGRGQQGGRGVEWRVRGGEE